MEPIVYLNGALVPRAEAKISPFDHGFLYGNGLFETMRAYSGHVFRLDKHLERLIHSAEILGFPPELDAATLELAVYDTLRANGLTNAYVRLTVSRGEGEAGPDPSTCKTLTIFIIAREYHPFAPEVYESGFSAIVSSIRQNSQSPLPRLKSLNYLPSILAKAEAKAKGVNEALFLNEQGYLTEGSVSNLFLVSDNTLITPKVGCGLLPGITRAVILELAPLLEMQVKEAKVTPEEICQAQESFLTNSLMEIMPLSKVEGQPIGEGIPGPSTRELMESYSKLVAREISRS